MSSTFSLSVLRHSQGHLWRKRTEMLEVATPHISREKASLRARLVNLAALVIYWFIIHVERRYLLASSQLVYVSSRPSVYLTYLAYPSDPSSKMIWRWYIEPSLVWGGMDMLVRAILEWSPLVEMTLVASAPNSWGWMLTAMLARYLRWLSFLTIPNIEYCSSLEKLRRKGGECKGGCSSLLIIIIIYTHIFLT